jgi:hypothetical protein
MVRKLMESFDTDAAKLAGLSSFDPETLTVHTRYGDVDEQLEGVEAELGIDQEWAADLEAETSNRVDVEGHREALAQTLRDRVEDIDDADRSGPSRRTDFSCSTGNSTNNSEATVRQHTLRAKALRNIDLVDRNYTLENDLRDTQDRMSALLAQNALLQSQLAPALLHQESASPSPVNDESMLDDSPMEIRGGGGDEDDDASWIQGSSSGREGNPYTRAYLGITRTPVLNERQPGVNDGVSGYSVHVVRKQSVRQRAKMARAQQWASSRSLQRLERLATRSATFLAHATPTVGQLLTHTQRRQGKPLLTAAAHHPPITNQVKVAQVQGAARASVV